MGRKVDPAKLADEGSAERLSRGLSQAKANAVPA